MPQVNGTLLFGGGALLVGVVVAGIGGWLVYLSVREDQLTGRRDEFEPVEAEVLHSDLAGGATGEAAGTVRWRPEVEYEYTVEGETFTNDSVWPGRDASGTDREMRQAVVDRYPEGEIVEAYYDPEDPAVSFLEDESQTTKAAVIAVMGGVFLVFGLGVFAFGALLAL